MMFGWIEIDEHYIDKKVFETKSLLEWHKFNFIELKIKVPVNY